MTVSRVERYGEDGAPVLLPEPGAYDELWSALALRENEEAEEQTQFDLGEFFKRLCMARAELDICATVLEMLASGGASGSGQAASGSGQDVAVGLVKHEAPVSAGDECAADDCCHAVKLQCLRSIAAELSGAAQRLRRNRQIEHDSVVGVLLPMRERYGWPLLRPSGGNVAVVVDAARHVPVMAIDYSPLRWFKTTGRQEQWNYRAAEQIGSDTVAVLLQDRDGDIRLCFQDARRPRHLVFSVRVTGRDGVELLASVASRDGEMGDAHDGANDVAGWDAALSCAQESRLGMLLLARLVAEAREFRCDLLHATADCFLMQLSPHVVVTAELCEPSVERKEPDGGIAEQTLRELERSFLQSAAERVDWKTQRRRIWSWAMDALVVHFGGDVDVDVDVDVDADGNVDRSMNVDGSMNVDADVNPEANSDGNVYKWKGETVTACEGQLRNGAVVVADFSNGAQ